MAKWQLANYETIVLYIPNIIMLLINEFECLNMLHKLHNIKRIMSW